MALGFMWTLYPVISWMDTKREHFIFTCLDMMQSPVTTFNLLA